VEEGIVIWQAKTKCVQLKEYTDRLRAAVNMAHTESLKYKQRSPFLIQPSRRGGRYTRSGFNATWIRMQQEAFDKEIIMERFRFHDTKHKGISDFDGDKQRFSGHASRGMMQVYNHRPERTATVDRPPLKGDLSEQLSELSGEEQWEEL
jgi:hypothetical protein